MENRTELPEEFIKLVRDALANLYDPARLHDHPLVAVAAGTESTTVIDGSLLRQAILDAFSLLRPNPSLARTSNAWRIYRILELRYLEGYDVSEVIQQVAISKRHYHREHHHALKAVASLLWERWQLATRWKTYSRLAPTLSKPESEPLDEMKRIHPNESGGYAGHIELTGVLAGVISLLKPLCVQEGVDVQVEQADDVPVIRGDRVLLRQAFLAILAHAISTSDQGIVKIGVHSEPNFVEVQIRGRASQPLDQDRLGMIESKRFVQALGGTIRYGPPSAEQQAWSVVLAFPMRTRPSLLVVDNSLDFIHLVERYLAGRGWDILGATEIDQAMALARQQQPQVILLDMVMPVRDGWDLLLELKRTPVTREIPVIVCSVLDEPKVALSLGASAYLHKPVHRLQLIDTVRQVSRLPGL